ncbi:MAG: DUF4956 domain-containing protein [Eubacteriales bacterium]|nr:DUF4956 domain-containing protein [Eubacteriales bacterium]
MKDKLYSLFENTGELTLQEVTANILMAAILGFLIFFSYALSHRGTIYSKKFNVSLVVLTVLTGTVMTVIGNNIALSLGMVGALSIVRFRTAVKDSRDTVYIFWTVIVGICCGVGDYLVAAVGSAIAFAVLLVLGMIKNDNRMLLIVRASRNRQSVIQSHIFKLFKRKAILRVRNTTEETVEFIYEISSKLLRKVESETLNVSDSLYDIGGVEYVNIVMQNEEISN